MFGLISGLWIISLILFLSKTKCNGVDGFKVQGTLATIAFPFWVILSGFILGVFASPLFSVKSDTISCEIDGFEKTYGQIVYEKDGYMVISGVNEVYHIGPIQVNYDGMLLLEDNGALFIWTGIAKWNSGTRSNTIDGWLDVNTGSFVVSDEECIESDEERYSKMIDRRIEDDKKEQGK